jgi:Ca-activated chloride channel homolog
MSEFHFLRPLWLLVLPIAVWAAWRVGTGQGGRSGWRAVVDKALQPFMLTDGGAVNQRRWPVLTALAASIIASLALAGPAWDRQPVPAYRTQEALVVAFDLSRSMDANDVEPSRLTRARIKLLDLLERREGGQTALVVFTANAFTVTPLTNDTRTISSLVNALGTDIMPSQGSLIEVGLQKSADLLAQTGVPRGEILLVTDATASPAAFRLAESLRDQGTTTSVLAVGTEEGGPIPALGGGFVTDDRGQVVVPQLNVDNLERLAAAGGGRFARLSLGDSDLDQLFPANPVAGVTVAEDDEREADIWRDQGIWLCLALLPLIALGFRRGWVYVLVVGFALPTPKAMAFDWSDLWLRSDQQGQRAMERDAPAEAADLFDDPEWRAAARYRAGQFDASAAALSGIDTADANYNRGNALAFAGNLSEAIDAYDAALEIDPDHEDARYNRDLVADLLEQQQQEQQQQDQQGDSDEQQSGQDQESDDEGDEQQQAQNSSGSDNEGDPQASNEDQRGTDPGDSGEDEETEPELADGEEEGETPQSLQANASPEELEDWASEQAAEQWLRRIPQDPGGLLRRKFLYQYQQQHIDQDGNRILPGESAEPW